MNPYEVLGIDYNISEEQLREAFIVLAKKFHPDTACSDEDRKEKEQRFKEIALAYNLLKGNLGRNLDKDEKENKKRNDVNVIKKKAHVFINNGDYNSAIDILKSIDEDDYEVNMLMGLALFKKKRYHGAVRHFKKAIELNPWKSEAYAYLGETYLTVKLKKSAIHYFKEALKIDPNDTVASKGIEKLNRDGFSIKSLFKKG